MPLAGNPLAVVHEADGLDDATMLAYARETMLSETTFVQTATDSGADYRNRIWTPAGELPFAGHPSLGTAVAVARRRGEASARYVQQTPAGLQPVEVTLGGDHAVASMLQEPARFGSEPDPATVFAAVGLTAQDAHPDLPCQFVSTGVLMLMAPAREASALARSNPDYEAIGAVLGQRGAINPERAITLYVCHLDGAAARARSYCHTVELGEDPATGSSAGPLMAYAHERLGLERLTITQGVEMGRPSELRCEWAGDRVRVGGDAVVIADGELRL